MIDLDDDLKSIQEMREVVKRTKEAQKKFQKLPQEQIDHIVKNIAEAAFRKSEYLARLAVEETGMGVIEHKKMKNELGSLGVFESIKDEKTVGIIGINHELKVTEIAYPFGVIAAICPVTNPTSTAIFKTIISLKTVNGIVVSPHPSAANCTIEALKICSRAAVEAGAPEGIIGWITKPTIQTTAELLKHKDIDLILATGGAGLVRAAYSSGKPAYGVGPGNGPVYIEKTANIKKAVRMITDSKTFDFGTLCSTEQAIVVHQHVKEMAVREFKNLGGYFLSQSEKAKLEKVISPSKGMLNPEIVGQPAIKIAAMAGLQVPAHTRLLFAEEERIGREIPFAIEKLAPIFPLYTACNDEEAKKICIALLSLGGKGHSCSIHTNDEKAAQQFGLDMPVSRIMVNTLASIGAAGATTGLIPSLTLGCGSFGGNISSDNITARHLLNIKRIAYGIREVAVPPPEYAANHKDEQTKDDNVSKFVNEVLKEAKVDSVHPDIISNIVKTVMEQYRKM